MNVGLTSVVLFTFVLLKFSKYFVRNAKKFLPIVSFVFVLR